MLRLSAFKIAILSALIGVFFVALSLIITVSTEKEIVSFLNKTLSEYLTNSADVSNTIKHTPFILMQIALGFFIWGSIGYFLVKGNLKDQQAQKPDHVSFSIPPWWYMLLSCILVFLLGYYLISHGLNDSFCVDEAQKAKYIVFSNWFSLWHQGLLDNMRMYAYFTKIVVELFGFSEKIMRIPNAVCYCLFAWFLIIISWNRKHRYLSTVGGVVVALFFMITPAAIQTAYTVRAHMMSAFFVAISSYGFVQAQRSNHKRRWLLLSVVPSALAMMNIVTSLAYFMSVWVVILLSIMLKRSFLSRNETLWFYTLNSISFVFILFVYAPKLPWIVSWLAFAKDWASFGTHTFLPWTNGWWGIGAVVLSLFMLKINKSELSVAVVPLTVAIVWLLVYVQSCAAPIYAAISGAGIMVICALAVQKDKQTFFSKMNTVLLYIVMIASIIISYKNWSAYVENRTPRSFAREAVMPIKGNETVLLVGHCQAPHFYLRLKTANNLFKANSVEQLKALLAVEEFDWIVLNASDGSGLRKIAESDIIPTRTYLKTFKAPQNSEDLWVWRNLRSSGS
ncbi:ArnT family glycosyltransferase [Fibrobacterota bacterium]